MEILCYKDEKIVTVIKLSMSKDKIEKQLRKGMLAYFNPDINATEIVYLKNYDRIVIENCFIEF